MAPPSSESESFPPPPLPGLRPLLRLRDLARPLADVDVDESAAAGVGKEYVEVVRIIDLDLFSNESVNAQDL